MAGKLTIFRCSVAFTLDVDSNPASVPAGAAAVRDRAPLYPSTGRGRHHWEAGSEHQAAVALRWSLYQGGPHKSSVTTTPAKRC